MRLVGFAFTHPDGPARWGYLELGDLTIVLGANDVGKSRIARWLAAWLQHTPPAHDEGGIVSGAFFARVEPDEFEVIVSAAEESFGGRRGRGEERRERLERQVGILAPLLLESGLLCFEPDVEAHTWTVWLCLPGAAHALAAEVIDAVRALGLERGDVDLERHMLTSFREAPCLAVPDAPAAVLRVGEVPAVALPLPVTAPRDWAGIRDRLASIVTDVADELERYDVLAALVSEAGTAAGAGERERVLDLLGPTRPLLAMEALGEDVPAVRWVTDEGGAVTLRDDVTTAARVLRELAQDAAPSFVSGRYSFDIDVAVTRLVAGAPPVGLGLWRLDAGTYTAVEDAADGLTLWLQLALLEAGDTVAAFATALRARRTQLHDLATDLILARDHLVAHEELLADAVPGSDESADARDAVEVYAEDIEAGLHAIAANAEQYRHAVERFRLEHAVATPVVPAIVDTVHASSSSGHGVARASLYLLDEPERHLHPALVPRAARWLSDSMRLRRSQAVVITHGVPFLALDHARFAYVARPEGSSSQVTPIDPDDLTALTLQAEELGLDRGQLLANVSVVLFVEGRADQIVLETLYGRRLRQAGIAVTPLTGMGKHAQIFDSDLLARFTSARLALMLDNVRIGESQRLVKDASALERALTSKNKELQAMAAVIRNARHHGRHVEPVPHPYDDIFDVLDEAVVTELYARFPGHAQARAQWAAAKSKQFPRRKVFYEHAFGIPNELAVYERVAGLMRDRLLRPAAELDEAIDALDAYTTELPATP